MEFFNVYYFKTVLTQNVSLCAAEFSVKFTFAIVALKTILQHINPISISQYCENCCSSKIKNLSSKSPDYYIEINPTSFDRTS